jgi:hypothetical protein
VAEIKSAIEIAMERTQNLVMNDREKREYAKKGLEDKLKAIVRRYLEEITDEGRFLEEYEGVAGDEKDKRNVTAHLALDEFISSSENPRIFMLLEVIGRRAGGDAEAEARSLKDQYRRELEKKVSAVKADILHRLKEVGISGDAVEPNLEAWDEWRQAVQAMGTTFRGRLEEWRDRLHSSSK